ncbi:MAG: penicillin-binding protein 1C [Treponema sp.]|nr:penicillin-binding protein 1C [Treponema sp.]
MITLLIAAGVIALFHAALGLVPYPELEAFRSRSRGLAVYDRNGTVLRVLPAADGVKREWASLEEIPEGAVRVFIRAEDRRFYFHPGVDPLSVIGSALRNIRAGRIVSGASTITMQLARLVRPNGPGLKGKIREAWDSLRLEAKLSKREILELWLNAIPFGSNIEGLPCMARSRFGRSVNALDDSRACLLAVVPRRPGLYDPALNPEAAVSAALALSDRCGLALDEASLKEAAAEASGSRDLQGKNPFRAPHFTERIAAMTAGGPEPSSVRTTLDSGLQAYAEELLGSELALLADNRVTNGAILAVENETGAVRIYVGSASWFDDAASGKIDGIRSRAQPGSCLKPFLYALALDSGFSPASVLPDLPTVFGSREAYVPSNFNRRFNGPVRFRVSLASSLNVPAVYLLERLGVEAFENRLVDLGFDSIAETRGSHGTGLALGNAEVSLEELVRAFAVFPRQGVPVDLKWVEDGKPPEEKKPLMSAYAAWMIADILSDKSSRFIGFGPAPVLATPFGSMFKTGTANQFQHIWALGATRRFTVGVWMGNFSGETVVGRTGSSIPARIASRLLAAMEQSVPAAAKEGPRENPGGPVPALAEETLICALSGMAAGPYCAGTVREQLERNRIPGVCTWHTREGVFYPQEYQSWLAERFRSGRIRQTGSGSIRLPLPGSVFYADPGLPQDAQALRLETAGFGPGALVYMDNALQGSLNHAGVFALGLEKGKHTVTVEDENSAASVDFEVR